MECDKASAQTKWRSIKIVIRQISSACSKLDSLDQSIWWQGHQYQSQVRQFHQLKQLQFDEALAYIRTRLRIARPCTMHNILNRKNLLCDSQEHLNKNTVELIETAPKTNLDDAWEDLAYKAKYKLSPHFVTSSDSKTFGEILDIICLASTSIAAEN